MTPNHQPSNSRADSMTYAVIYSARQPLHPTEGGGDPTAKILDGLPLQPGTDSPSFVDLRPTGPATPPEEIKSSAEKHPLKLSEPVVQAQLISRIEPRYPPLALQMRQAGTVVLHAVISRAGRINA